MMEFLQDMYIRLINVTTNYVTQLQQGYHKMMNLFSDNLHLLIPYLIKLFNLMKSIKLFLIRHVLRSKLIMTVRKSDTMQSLTMAYYFGYLDMNKIDKYHVRIFDEHNYDFIFVGELSKINRELLERISDKSPIKRKNVLFLDRNDDVCSFDIKRIDDYLANSEKSGLDYSTNLEEILKCFGQTASYVQTMTLRPFSVVVRPVKGTSVNDLYN